MAGWTRETPSEDYSSIDAKIGEWWDKLKNWLTNSISWLIETTARAIGAWISTVWAWVAKVGEKCCNKDNTEKREEKAAKAKMRIKKAWAHGKKALESTKTTIWWWFEAVGWSLKVAYNSGKKTFKSLRSEGKIKDDTSKEPETLRETA